MEMKRLTIRDVAERAGVSLGTVSNVLNRPHLVADATRKRVLAVVDEIGFVRNNAARQLRGVTSPAIGLVALDTFNPFFAEVARGIERAADEANHLVIVCNSAGLKAREDRQLRVLEEQRVAGILMAPLRGSQSRAMRAIRNRGTPIVLLDRRGSGRDQCSVSVDDIGGARMVAEHLVSLGHERIGLVNGPRTIQQCADRHAGFLNGLDKAGLSLSPSSDLEMPGMTIQDGEEAAARLLAQRWRPTAIFCTNDLLAVGAQHAFLARGVHVPDDLAIVGYDDVAFAEMSFVPLTSVRRPAYDLGYQATKLLLDESSNRLQHRHERVLFKPELIVRESTRSTGERSRPVVLT